MTKRFRKSATYTNPRLLAIVALVIIVGALAVWRIFAAGGRIFAVPSTTTVKPGDTFTVDVQADSGGTTVNAAQVFLTYPQDQLDVVSLDFSTAGIPHSTAVPTTTTSPITFSNAMNNTDVSGANIELAQITFHVKDTASGSLHLDFNAGTALIEDQNFTDVVNGNFGNTTINVQAPLQPPGVPANLHSTSADQNSITLAWDAPSTGGAPDSYVVTRTNDGTTLPATGTSVTDSGLLANTVYHYKVHALNSAGPGPDTAVVDVATLPAPLQPPGPVVGLAVTAHTSDSLTVNWQAPNNGGAPADYLVSAQPAGGAFGTPVQLDTNTLSFTFNGLTPQTQYTLKVRAENSAGGADATTSGQTDAITTNPTARLYLSPATATAATDSTVSFEVRVDTGGSDVNAVGAVINYPTDQFNNVTVDESTSDFPVAPAPATVSNGTIQIDRAATLGTTLNGDKLLAKINLHVIGTSGTHTIDFNTNASQVFNGDQTLLNSTVGANVTLFQNPNPGCPTCNPQPPQPPQPPTPVFTPSATSGFGSDLGSALSNISPSQLGTSPAPTDNSVTVTTLPAGQTAQVTIEVVDPNGKPVVGARVEIKGLTAVTDSNGNAVFKGMQAGDYTVNVTYNGKTTSKKIAVASPDTSPTQSFKIVIGQAGGLSKLPLAILSLIIIIVIIIIGYVLMRMGFFSRMRPKGELAGGGRKGGPGVHEASGTTFVPHSKSGSSGDSGTQVFYPKDDHKS